MRGRVAARRIKIEDKYVTICTLTAFFQAQPPLPETHWHRSTSPYGPFTSKPDRLACLSPLNPPEDDKNFLPRPHLP